MFIIASTKKIISLFQPLTYSLSTLYTHAYNLNFIRPLYWLENHAHKNTNVQDTVRDWWNKALIYSAMTSAAFLGSSFSSNNDSHIKSS